ncbi:hypothetical protein DPX16_6235 [Anabarilius grahami]|uniref:Secreted protein n=1 Tax=Anabarilius grahami TaxID=495550 RepID=A0A3N0XCY2_ANAGA|nr:hypothetical protein DPX16_6235 [Anabarilius grahami]
MFLLSPVRLTLFLLVFLDVPHPSFQGRNKGRWNKGGRAVILAAAPGEGLRMLIRSPWVSHAQQSLVFKESPVLRAFGERVSPCNCYAVAVTHLCVELARSTPVCVPMHACLVLFFSHRDGAGHRTPEMQSLHMANAVPHEDLYAAHCEETLRHTLRMVLNSNALAVHLAVWLRCGSLVHENELKPNAQKCYSPFRPLSACDQEAPSCKSLLLPGD